MITRFLQQAAIWKPAIGRDAYGTPQYGADTLIACRWEWKRRLVRNAAGQEVVSEGRVFLTAPVKVGDGLIDPEGRAWTVLTSSPQAGLAGRELYREVTI